MATQAGPLSVCTMPFFMLRICNFFFVIGLQLVMGFRSND
jgi:uncharacterized membrane protein